MTQPLLITSFGAVGDGKKDNTSIINEAAKVGKAQGQVVQVPAGKFLYSDLLTLDSVILEGVGPESVLYCKNYKRSAVYLKGNGAAIKNLKLSGDPTTDPANRTAEWQTKRVLPYEATNWEISGIVIDSGNSAAIQTYKASKGKITKCTVGGNLADGIHITDASSEIFIDNNDVFNTNDDCIAVVSPFGTLEVSHDIVATNNRVGNITHGRGMSIVGGKNIHYENNIISDVENAAGLYLAQENAYNTYGIENVVVLSCTIINSGETAKGHFAIMLFSDGAHKNKNVVLDHVFVLNDINEAGGIRVFSNHNEDISVLESVFNAKKPTQFDSPNVVVTPYRSGIIGYYGTDSL